MTSLSLAAVRQMFKYAIRVSEAVLLIIALAVATLVWRLSQSPLALDEVAPYLETELSEIAPGYTFDIANVSLSWRRLSQRPTFEVAGVTIRASDGAVAATLQSMAIRIDPRALLIGDIAVEHVGLVGPIVRVSRRIDGAIDVGLATSAEPDGASEQAAGAWLAGVFAPRSAGPPGAARLDTIDIENFTLIIDDRSTGRRWTVPQAQLNLLRQTNDIQMGASLPLGGAAGAATIDLAGQYVYASRLLSVTASFTGIEPAAVGDLIGLEGVPDIARLVIGGTVDADIVIPDAVPDVRRLDFNLTAGAGAIVLPERLGGAREIASASARGTIGAGFNDIRLDELTIRPAAIDSEPVITVAGRASNLGGAPVIELNASASEFSLTALKQLWPVETARSTRAWIEKNLSGGGLSGLSVSARFAGPTLADVDAVDLDLAVDLRGIRVHYIDGLPDVEETDGRLKMNLKQVVIDVTHGRIPGGPAGRDLKIPRADLRMGDLSEPRTFADFTIDIEGDLGDVLRYIDHKPLEYAKKMQVTADGASGAVRLQLDLDFPLIKALKLADLKIDIDADVKDAHIENVTFGLPLDDGVLKLHVTETFLEARGTTKLGPIRTGLTWRENFSGGEFRSQYALDAILENEHRPLVALGRAPFVAPYMDGPVRTEVVYTVRRDGTAMLAAEADFEQVALAIPELSWTKSAGLPARGHADVLLKNGRLAAVERFELASGDDLKIDGRAEFGPDNTLSRVAIGESRVGRNTMAADLLLTADGIMDLEVRGRELDVSYFWKDLGKDESRGQAAKDQQPLRLKAAVDRIRLTKEGDFDQVRLVFERNRKIIEKVDFSGRVASGKPFTLTLGAAAQGRSFKAVSDDAGGVLRSIGLFDDIVGGALAVDGSIGQDGVVAGTVEITDFQLVDAPFVARVLSVAALTGIADELAGKGISFSALRVPFTYTGSTLRLKDGEMYGPALGMTMAGNYQFGGSIIDVEGTLVPAYVINAALTRIPLVGGILSGGEKGSGIFAATYRWNGPTASTGPTVNPLAALTPGILRKFFSIFETSPKAPEPSEENLAPG